MATGQAGAPPPEHSRLAPEVQVQVQRPLKRLTDPEPLFGEAGRAFSIVSGTSDVRRTAAGVELTVNLDDGSLALLIVEATASGALHLGWRCPAAARPPVTLADGMLSAGAEPGGGHVLSREDEIVVGTRAMLLRIDRRTLAWRLEWPDGRPLTRQRDDDRNFTSYVAFPLGTTRGEGRRTWSYDSIHLAEGERLYGLGQDFLGLQKRGRRAVLYNQDAYGLNGTPLSYHGCPVLWSSRGWGVVVHTGGRALFEMGNPSHDTLTVAAEGDALDLYLFAGDGPPGLLRAFYELAGAPPPIPAWALGTWMSRCMYTSREQVRDVVRRLEELDFPFDVVHLDPGWMREHQPSFTGRFGADFTWGEEKFGPAAELFAELRERGLRVSLWENPYALAEAPIWSALERLGGIARTPAGPAWSTESPGDAAIVDFWAPAVAEWWAEQHRRLLADGAAAFKTDFGEGVPDDAVFADGRTGAQVHNLYALAYNRTVAEASGTLVFGRSGWLGSHRYPLQWSGDARSTFEDMRGALRGGLSAALSGTAYWASDLGGFYAPGFGPVDPELYTRWAQLGAVSPVARFHGTSPREPYEFPREACDAAVEAVRLRYRLLPYLAGAMADGTAGSLPMMRPLLLEWPGDWRVHDEATEFMLGPDLLAAPVLEPGGARTVYLPAGAWHDWWSGSRLEGPAEIEATWEPGRFPLYQRADSVVKLGRGRRVSEVLEGPIEEKRAGDAYTDL